MQIKYFLLFTMTLRIFMTATLLLVFAASVTAQSRLPYEALRQSNRNPAWYRQSISIPSSHPDSMEVNTVFRIPYSSIVFKKTDASTSSWTADLTITFDALTVTSTERPTRRIRTRSPLEPERSLGRAVWTRILTTDSYDITQSDSVFVEGVVTLKLARQPYRVVPLIQVNGQTSPITTLPAPEPPPSKAFTQFVVTDSSRMRLVNLGPNIEFGQRADLVVGLANDTLARVEIWRIDGAKDSSLVWSASTDQAQWRGRFIGFTDTGNGIEIATSDSGLAMVRFTIPAHNFENTMHRVMVLQDDRAVHRVDVLPRWFNIPISLLNLDTAIDMMRFALSPTALRDMRKGNEVERKRNFDAFWKPRDPTPESAFNELMAEYFERIDQAFQAFSTPQRPGYDSPMGKTWIQFGKPASVDRRFPPEGGTIVVWEYPGRRFIFRATSGFGDFELVSPT
jgi:GWxTD domain-containing protein